MRVIQILPRLEGGGVERGTLEVANYLIEHNHESIVVSQGGRLVRELEAEGTRHIKLRVGDKSPLTLFSVSNLVSLFKQLEPDIVHPRSRLPGWLTYFALKRLPSLTKTHLVTSVHGLHSISKYSSIIGRGEMVEVVSDAAKEYLLENYSQIDEPNIRVIYRGIDPTIYTSTFKPSQKWLDDFHAQVNLPHPKTIVLPGRVSRLKGHEFFLNVLKKLLRDDDKLNALIVGDPEARGTPYLKELKQIVSRSQQLSKSVVFLPHRIDLREIMSISDLVVNFSSKPESFGRVVLESLSLGTPVVGFNYGGVGDLLSKLYPHGLVEPNDAEGAVDTIKRVLSHEYPIAQHRYTQSEMCRKTLEMYQDVMQ